MSYLVYDALLPMDDWYESTQAARDSYAQAHQIPVRSENAAFKYPSLKRLHPDGNVPGYQRTHRMITPSAKCLPRNSAGRLLLIPDPTNACGGLQHFRYGRHGSRTLDSPQWKW